MDADTSSGGHFDLLGAALSESGLDGLADEFGEDDHGSSTPMPAQVVARQPPLAQSTPRPALASQMINVRTPASSLSHGQIIVTQAGAMPQSIRVVQSTDPNGSRTPVTKVIRIPQGQVGSNSLLRTSNGTPIITSQTPNGQRIVQRMVSTGTPGSAGRIIISHVPNGGGNPQTKSIIMTPQSGSATPQISKNIIITPQGAKSVGNTVARKIFVTRNGQTLTPITTTANGHVVLASQLLHTAGGGERFLLNQANGQIVRVTSASLTSTASVSGTPRVVTATTPQHTQIIRSPSVGHLRSITLPSNAADRSPLQIINKTGLGGGKVITASSAPSPGPPPLHHSASLSALSNGDAGSRSNSPVYSIGNIPTVVSQKLHLGNLGSLSAGGGGGGGGVPMMQPVTVTNKDISRMWSNEAECRSRAAGRQHTLQQMAEEVEEEESEELGHAETYAEYMPTKLRIGLKHPDPVVETSSLSSVEPQDVKYQLSIPESTIDSGVLSALQLEAITYASQRHSTILPSGERAGYLIGDGAGVGKGRTVAGVIFENYLLGRKRALWLSVSNDLKVDAERDLRDIGAHKIDVYALNKFKYAKISSKENNSVKKGVVFATYSSLIGESQSFSKYRTRLKQLLKWCGKDFEGVIVFDECHKAKNLCPTGSTKPTKTGMTVMELQNRLPKARVIYASATGASEPKNMAYMTRLGLWGPGTPFKEFNDFISAVEKRGVGAMELVAMDMKLRGMYIARQLSFKGVTFKIEEIPLEPAFKKVYDDAVELWVEARAMFQKAADLIQAEHRMRKSMWGQFWSAHQRFFKYLCISAKVSHCVAIVREAVKAGKCVVMGLQSTGEARTVELVEEQGADLNDFVSTAKGVFQTLVEKHFPAPNRQKTWDMLGLGDIMQGNSNNAVDNSLKRKRDEAMSLINKRSRMENRMENSSDDNHDSSDSLSDLSLDSDSSDSDGDRDSNPFGGGSDSDEDPWLKKSKKKKKSKPPKKEKTKKKKGSKKMKNSSDEEDEFCDKALAQVSFMKKSSSYAGFPNNTNGGNGALNIGGNGMEQAFTMKTELLNLVERLGDKLPANTLDHLIDELGGPDNVAEMTGRKGRVVQNDDGIQYESRSENDVPLEILNLTEKQRFMDGEKDIAIISEAASSGISLQADRRVINQKRRVHITLELPWSADRAIQQFGRTHRSNQVSAPEYIFLISELAGERRFAATVAKRLESLGALTHGDRRATESRDLSRFNIDNRYGRAALDVVMRSIAYGDAPLVEPPKSYKGNFFKDVKVAVEGVGLLTVDETSGITSLDKDFQNISKFLNRLLGMPVDLQNSLFEYFNQSLSAIILEAKRSGRWDMGILDLGSGQERVKKMETRVFVGNTATNTAKTELSAVQVERGMAWSQAMDIWRRCQTMEEGFYVSLQERNLKRTAILVVVQGKNKKREKVFSVYRPNTGLQARAETLDEIKKKYKKVLPDEAERRWEDQYYASAHVCTHAYWNGNCKKTSLGLPCEIGLRTRQYHVLSGSVLSVWSRVESVLTSMPSGNSSKMQIIRLRTDDGSRIVGSLIPQNCVAPLTHVLSQDSARTYTEKHQQSLESAINGLKASSALSSLAANTNGRPTTTTYNNNNTTTYNNTAINNNTNSLIRMNTSTPVAQLQHINNTVMTSQSAPSEAMEDPSTPGSSEPIFSMPTFDFL
ncbi:protein strawberry notch homolog 1-like [Littorina saxatilis]|uniref:protein strawberry notch homolog 1-like n=1 Tax=Littorina saxatilis TaxID=31220 RepID=UPI0038B4208B